MRKIIACEFMTIDGVIQNEENDGDGFKYGGWFFPMRTKRRGRGASAARQAGRSALRKKDLRCLGNVLADAFELLAERDDRNEVRGLEHTQLKRLAAQRLLSGDLAEKVRQLKQTDAPDLHVMGSANMLQTLFKNDLVDELHLMILPITLGAGKRLFADGTIPAAFKVTYSQVSPNGIIIVNYERAGEVKTGAPQIEEDDK